MRFAHNYSAITKWHNQSKTQVSKVEKKFDVLLSYLNKDMAKKQRILDAKIGFQRFIFKEFCRQNARDVSLNSPQLSR